MLLLVKLMRDGNVDFAVTVSQHFAEQHGITTSIMELEDAIGWLTLLVSMCNVCYAQRWPILAAEMKITC